MVKFNSRELVNKLQLQMGFEITENIQDNHRYRLCAIRQDGKKRILKVVKDPELISNLTTEVNNTIYISTVSKHRENVLFRVRSIYSFGEGWYIGEHFDGSTLFKKRPIKDVNQKVEKATDRLALLFADIESYTPAGIIGKPVYTDRHGNWNKRYKTRLQEVKRHMRVARAGGFLSRKDSDRLWDYINKNAESVTSCMEMFDFEPWELFELDKGVLGVIDVEYVDLAGRRYFDVVWNYLRLWADLESPEAAKKFLKNYLGHRKAGSEDLTAPFFVLFSMKLTGYLRDAALWYRDTEEKGLPLVYPKEVMSELLQRCLRFEISALTD